MSGSENVHDPGKAGEISERYWDLLIKRFGWLLERNANCILGCQRINASAPSRDHVLRTGLMKDGAGKFWCISDTPGIYRNLVTNEPMRNEEIPTPHIWGTFPEEAFGWALSCNGDGESEVERNVREIARLESANREIEEFIATAKDGLQRVMVAHAELTRVNRAAFERIRSEDRSPCEGEWTNRSDAPAIVAALNLGSKSFVAFELKSDGALIGTLLNWLEELSGLQPAAYAY